MSPYGFFSMLRVLGFVAIVALFGIFFCATTLVNQLRTEAGYRHQFGAGWQVEYEKDLGSLATARTRAAVGGVGAVVLCGLSVWLCRLLGNKGHSPRSRRSRKHQSHRYGSRLEHIARCRRNAVLGVYFGLVGILGGLFLVLFRAGLFADHTNELVLGIFVFLAGYAGVITGCSWWLKAKQWNEAIVFIGLMPLAVACIPFVRLVFFAMPSLLAMAMVMMPLILIVVVLVLPDRSGHSRRGSWNRGHHRSHHGHDAGSVRAQETQPQGTQAESGAAARGPQI